MSLMRSGWLAVGLVGCSPVETQVRDLHPTLSVLPDVLEFGEVGLPLSATGQVSVENAGKADLTVTVTLEGGDAFSLEGGDAFSLEGSEGSPPSMDLAIEPGEEVALNVGFTPDTYRDFEGRLVFSDSNDEEHPTWTVPIRGTGVDLPLPRIHISPGQTIETEEDVAPGESAQLTFTIQNVGSAELILDEAISFEGDVDRFVPLFVPPAGTKVFPGQETNVIVTYTPDDNVGDDVIATVHSNDPLSPETPVLLVGNGGNGFEPPLAVIDCPANVLLTGPEWVHLDGSGSTDPSGTELTYEWTVTRPEGSDDEVPIDPDDQPEADVYVDVVGLYTVQLVVRNALDTPSLPALCVFDAVPEDDIHVELTWDTPSADVDLHLTQAGSPIFAVPEDCNWCNTSPDWGAGTNDDDPRLDIDDRAGYGPENINVLVPGAGDYEVRVHYFEAQGDGPLIATVKIWMGGLELDPFTRVMEEHEVWDVATISWPSASWVEGTAPSYRAPVTNCQD